MMFLSASYIHIKKKKKNGVKLSNNGSFQNKSKTKMALKKCKYVLQSFFFLNSSLKDFNSLLTKWTDY